MNMFKNISNQFISLNEIMSNQNFVNFERVKENLDWKDCPILSLETSPSRKYIIGNLPRGERICFDKSSFTKLCKIDSGLFAGCYCLIEQSNVFCPLTRINILTKDKTLNFFEAKSFISMLDVDKMLEYREVVIHTAKILHIFDISKKYQNYQFFCEKLPMRCWKDKNFVFDVLTSFETMGEIEIVGVENKKYINVEECEKDTKEFFLSCAGKFADIDSFMKIDTKKDKKQEFIIS